MELIAVLGEARSEILEEASLSLERSRLEHYGASGKEELRRRLEALFDIVVDCLGVAQA